MTILFLILKIIGILLLVLMGLLLLITFVVLFVPFRFQARAVFQKSESPSITLNLSFFLHFIRLKFTYFKGEANTVLHILFFRKKASPTAKQKETKRPGKNKQDTPTKEQPSPTDQVDDKTDSGETTQSSKHAEKQKPRNPAGFIVNISTMMQELRKEENKKAWSLCIRELKYLCRHFGPRRLKGNLNFSLGDPAYTGIVLGAVSMFPVVYRTEFHINPDFQTESAYAQGELVMSGRIRLIHALVSFIRLFMNKTIRSLFNKGGNSNVRE